MSSFSPTSAVRKTCHQWMTSKKSTVSINNASLTNFANEITKSILSNKSLEVTEWDADNWHYTGVNYQKKNRYINNDEYYELMRMERVALYILTLDAINFCFWPISTSISDSNQHIKNGLEYEHLAIALRKIAESDDDYIQQEEEEERPDSSSIPFFIHAANSYAFSPNNLAALSPTKLHSMIQPHLPPSSQENDVLIKYELPNIEVRCKLLNELGNGLLEKHNGSALRMISKAYNSADLLVGIILETFPGFRDFVLWNNTASSSESCDWKSAKTHPSVVHFYKRAQIAVSDIWAALGKGKSNSNSADTPASLQICQFNDMQKVTTFPDYRVPQILRHVGCLEYNSALAKLVDDQVEIQKSSIDEVSIRAGTVVAVEEIVKKVKENILSSETDEKRSQNKLQVLADDVSAVTIDWKVRVSISYDFVCSIYLDTSFGLY